MKFPPPTRCLILVTTMSCGLASHTRADDDIDFARDIRPILSENCIYCHGPDEQHREAGLRLDLKEHAFADHDGLIAFVPGDLDKSEAWQRISTHEAADLMPPPDSNKQLTGEQKELLKRWIESGAKWTEHWAFVAPQKPEPPTAPGDASPIDRFLLARLGQKQLAPSPEADRGTLIRRLTLDLTGLPSTLEEIDGFLRDESPEAPARLVDRLLESPAYGERMASDWLDLARYADTYGYQNDRENRVWPWRDWLIRAFNENLSYDQFITWQLAGDLLPSPEQDQILATAFNRLHRQTNEGGSVLEEFRVEYVADRTHTFGTAFLGMTFECARCHDHKYDPISQKDYYSLSAFFSNIDESGMYSHFTEPVPSPSAFLYSEGQREAHRELKDAISQAEAAVQEDRLAAKSRFQEWLSNPLRPLPIGGPAAHLTFDEVEGTTVEDRVNPDYKGKAAPALERVEGRKGRAIRFTGDDAVDVKHAGQFERTDPFSFSLWLKAESHAPRQVVFHRSMAAEDAASRGYELLLEEGRLDFALAHFWPGNAVRVQTVEAIPAGEWVHLVVTYDGSSRAEGLRIFINGEAAELSVIRDNLFETIRYGGGESDPPLRLGARFRDSGFKNGIVDEFLVFDRELSAIEAADLAASGSLRDRLESRIAGAQAKGEPDPLLFEYYLKSVDSSHDALQSPLRRARALENAFAGELLEIMVMKEMPERRPTYLLQRGEYDKRREEVAPDAPASILPFPSDLPRDRLGLAQWLLHPDHPLTSRVVVNRIWKMFFGTGLVRTPEDFGNQGSPPSHPALLDHLARRFVESGWDVKKLCREIALSSTYGQSSLPRPDLRDKDPHNEWLARGPRHRLTAEQIRDSALASSGLLVKKIGGPSVKPYQPEGLWRDASSVEYQPDTGEGLYRRSMYTFIKRTVPPPMMTTFDAPNREVCIARREVTATPLQALVVMNDPQFVEAARVLAAKVIAEDSLDEASRVRTVFRILIGREPDPTEQSILLAALGEQRGWFTARPEEAAAYIRVGDSPVPDGIDNGELAAMTAVAQICMNHDEFQVKR